MQKQKYIIFLSLLVILLSTGSFMLYQNSKIKFEGKEIIVNETLATLKEGESINLKHKDSNTVGETDVYFKENKLAHFEKFGLTFENEKIIYLDFYDSTIIESKNSIENGFKKDRYLYEYNLEENAFMKKYKLKNYPATAIEMEGNNSYIAYFNAENITQKKITDSDLDEYDATYYYSNKTGSQISNIETGKNIVIKDRYVYNIVAEKDKVYAIVSQKITNKRPLHNVYYDANEEFGDEDKPKDVFIYNQELKKIGEMKKGKKAFVEKNFKKINSDNDFLIERGNAGLYFKDNYNDTALIQEQKRGQLVLFKDNKEINKKYVEFIPKIWYLRYDIYYFDKNSFILEGSFYKQETDDFETMLLKINLETLEWEPFLEPEKPDESLLLKD